MLTLDDLDHFGEARHAPLFPARSADADTDTAARLARILACLNFCREIPDDQLLAGGAGAARAHLRQAARAWRRKRIDGDEFARALDAVGALLGVGLRHADESEQALALRSALEAAIEQAADDDTKASADAELLACLARGDFDLMPSSELDALPSTSFNRAVEVDVDFVAQTPHGSEFVRVHLRLECGLWRWSANPGCCMSRNGAAAVFLDPDDGLVAALIAGLALRNGRPARDWADALAQGQLSRARSA